MTKTGPDARVVSFTSFILAFMMKLNIFTQTDTAYGNNEIK